MSKTFAIIGCGRIADRHAEHIVKYGKLVAVCDNVKEKADRLALLYGARAFYDIDDLLRSAKPDIIAVCTPNGLHAAHSIKILEAGIHVLCEKPMAISTEDCREMMTVAENAGKNLFIVMQNRFNPPVEYVKRMLDEGKLGKIYSIQLNCFWNRDPSYYKNSWKGSATMDGGTLFTQFSHFIDLLYWMFGEIRETKAFLTNSAHKGIIEFEDSGVVIIDFESNAIGTLNYTVNSHNKNMEGSLTIFGEKGTVKIGGEYLNRIDYQNIDDVAIPFLPDDKGPNQYGSYQGSMSNHDKVYQNIIDFLVNKVPVYISPEEGMKTVEIIERVYSGATILSFKS